MKKQLSKSVEMLYISIFSITGLVLILSYKPHVIDQHDSTIDEIEISTLNNNRIMPLIDEDLQKDYELYLLENKKESELENQFYNRVKSIKFDENKPKENNTYKSPNCIDINQNKPKKVKKKPMNRWNISLSKDEINLLANIIWLESRGESETGRKAVCEVIFNRMIHDKFNGTLYEVLSAKNQFSSWGGRNKAKPSEDIYKDIDQVLSGKTQVLSKDYVYFSTSPRNNKGVVKIGNHYFCKY